MKKFKKTVICFLLGMVICSLIIFLSVFHICMEEEDLAAYYLNNATVAKTIKLEYDNVPIEFKNYLSNLSKNVHYAIDTPIEYANQIGSYDVVYHLTYESDYGKVFKRDIPVKVVIVDTQYPIIEMTEKNDGILNVYDPIDGKLRYIADEKPSTFTIKEGKIIATDKNGNQTIEVLTENPDEPKTINFDETYECLVSDESTVQRLIDNNYMVKYFDDYFHMNTKSFLSVIKSLNIGDRVIINNINYVCMAKLPGRLENNELLIHDNTPLLWDDQTELITNDGSGNKRIVVSLENIFSN